MSLAEQKCLEKIENLSHADEVIAAIGMRLDDYNTNIYGKYVGRYSKPDDETVVTIVYSANYGYRLTITKHCAKVFDKYYQDYTGVVSEDVAKLYSIIQEKC